MAEINQFLEQEQVEPKTRSQEAMANAEALEAQYSPGAIDAALYGAGTAIAGPAIPIIQSQLFSKRYAEKQEQSLEKHQLARAAGSIGGYLAGAVTGMGIPGLLVKGSGAMGPGLIGRVGSGILEGGGISLSEATSESVVDRTLDRPFAAREMAESVGIGMGVGGGLGVISAMMPAASNFLFRKAFDKRISAVQSAKKELAEAGAQHNALTAEVEALMAETAPSIQKTFRLNKILGKPGTKNEGLLADAGRGMNKADQRVHRALYKALDDATDSARTSGAEALLDGAMLATGGTDAFILRRIMSPALKSLSGIVFSGISHLTPVKALLSASLHAGKISSKKLIRQGAEYVPVPTRYDSYINVGKSFSSALKVPPIQYMTRDQFDEISQEVASFDPLEYERSLRFAMAAKGMPQEVASSMVEQQLRVNSYLLQSLPPPPPPKWIANEESPTTKQKDIAMFSRKMRTAMFPASALSDLLNGTLTAESAQAWWATQPVLAGYMAERIRNMINIAVAHGKKFTPKEKKQFGLMVDPGGQLTGRTHNAGIVQLLQANYLQEEGKIPPPQVGGPKPPGDPGAFSGYGQSATSASQSLGNRLQTR